MASFQDSRIRELGRLKVGVVISILLLLTGFLGPARALRSDNLVFYSPSSHAVIRLEIIGEREYLPLFPLLNVMGKVGALQEKKQSLRVWFGEKELEIQPDRRKVRVGGNWLELAEPVRRAKGQWMVPLDFLTAALPQLAEQRISHEKGSHRVFIGDVRPGTFTVRVDQTAEGARLVFEFTDPVSLRTVASDGRWVLYLGSRPLAPRPSTLQVQNAYVKEVAFDDQDGIPKLVITPTSEDLNFYPTLAEGRRLVVAEIRRPGTLRVPAQVPEPSLASGEPAHAPAPVLPGEPLPPAPPPLALPAIVLDAGHGGEDTGARSQDGVLEKNLVAQLVTRVRLTLMATNRYRVIMTRTGDINPTFEQRSVTANTSRPLAFVSFHAGNLGLGTPRIMVYSYRSSFLSPVLEKAPPRPLFVPWDRAQEFHLDRSRQLALTLQQRLGEIPGATAGGAALAPLRVLRTIDAPAVAIEIGSLTLEESAAPLTNPVFLGQVAAAVTQGLSAFTGGGP
jgi:N-acetylmuramoyl-L-alanine amidase